jgi:hypothetical protein
MGRRIVTRGTVLDQLRAEVPDRSYVSDVVGGIKHRFTGQQLVDALVGQLQPPFVLWEEHYITHFPGDGGVWLRVVTEANVVVDVVPRGAYLEGFGFKLIEDTGTDADMFFLEASYQSVTLEVRARTCANNATAIRADPDAIHADLYGLSDLLEAPLEQYRIPDDAPTNGGRD